MATDPRKKANPRTVNEILVDRTIRHAVYLIRLGGGEAKWANEQMPELRRRVTEVVSSVLSRFEADPDAPMTAIDQELMLEASDRAAWEAETFFDQLASEYEDRLVNIGRQEIDWESRLFQSAIPIEMNFNIPSDRVVRNIMRTEPISGATLDQWFRGLSANVRANVNEQIRAGMLEGESVDKIIARIRGTRKNRYTDGILEMTRQETEALVRTGVMKTSARARQEFHKENEDAIKGYQLVLTLDSRTCPICVAAEKDNPYPLEAPPEVPLHINCRCLVVAITKSWQELGIDLDEMKPGTRASMDGEVPETMTYPEWFDRQPAEVQKDILGESRYAAYKQGMKVTAFADRGQILTLEELRAKEPDIFNN